MKERHDMKQYTDFVREPDVLAVMHAADAIGEGQWTMRCPAHSGGSSNTLEVTLSAGRYTLRCCYGCSPDDIIRAAVRRLDSDYERCEAKLIASAQQRRASNAGAAPGDDDLVPEAA